MPVHSSSCLLSCDLYPIYDSHYGGYTSFNQEHSQVLIINNPPGERGEQVPRFNKSTTNTYSKYKDKRSQQG